MFKVFFSEKAINDINAFTIHIKEYFKKLYSDTGIYNEKEIVEAYIKSYDTLQQQIIERIQEISENGLLGRNPVNETEAYNTFFIRSYIIVFSSRTDRQKKEITIESIRIGRS